MAFWNELDRCRTGILRLNRAERRLAARTLALHILVALQLRCFGFQGAYRRQEKRLRRTEPHPVDPALLAVILSVLRHAPVGRRCLPRALTLFFLARRAGWQADLRVGVCPDTDAFQAHAWVELEGRPYFADISGESPIAFPVPLQDRL